MILTDIGEIGVHMGADCYKLRPSLYAISQLGTPQEIVALFAAVMSDRPPIGDVLGVIHACSDQDLSHVFGCFVPARAKGAKGFRFKPGAARTQDAVHIARSLLRHGVVGALPPLERKDDTPGDYTTGFDARANAAVAMAHLGATSTEAWQMTMTELVGAMRAKFPPMPELDDKGRPVPPKMSAKEYEDTMEYGDAVMAALARKKGK